MNKKKSKYHVKAKFHPYIARDDVYLYHTTEQSKDKDSKDIVRNMSIHNKPLPQNNTNSPPTPPSSPEPSQSRKHLMSDSPAYTTDSTSGMDLGENIGPKLKPNQHISNLIVNEQLLHLQQLQPQRKKPTKKIKYDSEEDY